MKRSQIELDTKLSGSSAPLYEQVYNALRSTIATNPRAVGETLPSEAVLSERYGVSRITVRQALQMLETEGFIQKSKARRTRVSAPPQIMLRKQISSIEDITRGGAGQRSIVKSFRMEAPDEQVVKAFDLREKIKLRCLQLELLWQERPIGHSAIYFDPNYGEQLSRADFAGAVFIFPVLQRRFGLRIASATVQISAVSASEARAEQLGCRTGTALVDQTFIFRNERGKIVQVNRNQFLGEHYTLTYELGRPARSARTSTATSRIERRRCPSGQLPAFLRQEWAASPLLSNTAFAAASLRSISAGSAPPTSNAGCHRARRSGGRCRIEVVGFQPLRATQARRNIENISTTSNKSRGRFDKIPSQHHIANIDLGRMNWPRAL